MYGLYVKQGDYFHGLKSIFIFPVFKCLQLDFLPLTFAVYCCQQYHYQQTIQLSSYLKKITIYSQSYSVLCLCLYHKCIMQQTTLLNFQHVLYCNLKIPKCMKVFHIHTLCTKLLTTITANVRNSHLTLEISNNTISAVTVLGRYVYFFSISLVNPFCGLK